MKKKEIYQSIFSSLFKREEYIRPLLKRGLQGIGILSIFFSCSANAGNFDYSIHGKTDALYGYSEAPKYHNTVVDYSEINLSGSYEINYDTKISLNLDLMFGLNKQNEDFNNGDWGKELYGIIDTKYGRVMLGETYNVAYQFGQGAAKVGAIGVNNSAIVDFIENPNWQRVDKRIGYKTLNSSSINTDGVAPKISYISPEFYNSYVGFSYIPDIDNRRGLVSRYNHYEKSQDAYVAALMNVYDLGFADMTTSLGYGLYRRTDNEFSAGISLARGGWTLAGSWRKTYVDGNDNPLYLDLSDAYREGEAWDIGLSYEIGPYEVALSYFNSQSDNFKNEDRIILLSNKYQVNKWLNFYLAAAHVDFKDEFERNKGYAFLAGAGLEF